ncbi:MAG: hypothetical protein ACI4TD_08530, partial [Phocaeicola sp.]
MKWGVRRYQNKDGSLTDAGGKRYNGKDYEPRKSIGQKIKDYKTSVKRKKNLKKAREARVEKKKQEAEQKAAAEKRKKDVESGKISAKNMTSEELNERINKLNLEKKYNDLMKETRPDAKVVAKGKGFINDMWDKSIKPAVTEASKDLFKDVLLKEGKKALGLDKKDKSLETLAKEWQNKETIAKAKKTIYENERQLRRAMENDRRERASEREENARQQVDEYNRRFQQENDNSGRYHRRGNTIVDNRTDTRTRNRRQVENPPAGVESSVRSLSNVQMNSQEYANRAYRGERVAVDVLDRYGNEVVSFDENGNRR